jgi:hypothetical protein
MNTYWIYTVPGSFLIAAILAWPMSQKESQSLFDRIRFCLLSMMGFALLIWGLQQPPNGFHGGMGFLMVDGSVIAMMAVAFLMLLWFDKVTGMMADMLLGCMDVSDDSPWDSKYETRQIEQAVQLYRRGKRNRALRLCNRIIESNSQYTSTATTLAYWIENPDTLRFIKPPRTSLRFKGRFSSLNHLFWSM